MARDASDEDIRALRSVVSEMIADLGGTAAARRRLDTHEAADDPDPWKVFATGLGLATLGIPEELGGAGGGVAELCAVAEEVGAHLFPVPMLSSTTFSGQLLASIGAPAAGLIERMAAGERMTAVLPPEHGSIGVQHLGIEMREGRPFGTAPLVLDADRADHLLVPVPDADGSIALRLVDPEDEGVVVRALPTLDPSRSWGSVQLDGPPSSLVASDASPALERALDVALLVQAAELLGAAQSCLDRSVEHLGQRVQFGRPIGSFQAPKHKAADMLVRVEMMRSAVDRALQADLDDPRVRAEVAAVASSWAKDAATWVATETVHLHGGIGFTWEHDAHLYLRRARGDAAVLGSPSDHRDRLATLLDW